VTGALKRLVKHNDFATLRMQNGFLFKFRSPGRGSLSITWSTRFAGQAQVILSATAKIARAGPRRINLLVTSEGDLVLNKTALKKNPSLRVHAVVSFTPAGGAPARAAETFELS
jgi:hypothetical protein